jgi:hypothetical protein
MLASFSRANEGNLASRVRRTSGVVEHHAADKPGRPSTTVVLALSLATDEIATIDVYLLASSGLH